MNPTDLVRSKFKNKTVALVGGDPRPECADRVRRAFALREAIWLPTREKDPSPGSFAPTLKRREVALVVALYGLLRHQHARDLRQLCRRLRIPLVAYRRTPNPNGLAVAIVQQLALDEQEVPAPPTASSRVDPSPVGTGGCP